MSQMNRQKRNNKHTIQEKSHTTSTLNEDFWNAWNEIKCSRPVHAEENKNLVYFSFEVSSYNKIIDYHNKPSSLNIAQVKQKYGIIERENHNKPKSSDAKQPQCTKNKENAIVDVLKYFRII